jgi:hypothetical protein
LNIQLLNFAEDDIVDGYYFYEDQSMGLVRYFADSIYSDIESLLISSGSHIKINGKFRLLSKRFPFAIYYTTNIDTIFVHSVLDCRRKPAWMKTKLNREEGK